MGQGTASIARTGELGGKVDVTVLIAQETGSGKYERSRSKLWQILAQLLRSCKKKKKKMGRV